MGEINFISTCALSDNIIKAARMDTLVIRRKATEILIKLEKRFKRNTRFRDHHKQ